MNLNILTSGLITSKFGIRPALMCATKKDLSRHSVIRILSESASGWIGIAYGHMITGAKCQQGSETLSGYEALSVFLKLESGAFDLIQLDSRLLGDELAQSIGISIDDLLEKIKTSPEQPVIEILRICRKADDAISVLLSTEKHVNPVIQSEKTAPEVDSASDGPDDEDWDLGDGSVLEPLRRQEGQFKRNPSSDAELVFFASNEDLSLESELFLSEKLEPAENVQTFEAFPEVSLSETRELPARLPESRELIDRNSLASPEQASSGFVLLAQGKDSWLNSSVSSLPTPAQGNDKLGAELRAELHKFVEERFGVEGKKFFEELDLELSQDYQASVVLKDLESAIERAQQEDLAGSGSFHKLAESVERLQLKAEEAERISNWHRNRSTGEHRIVAAEADDSRRLVQEKIRRSTEVDTKAFLANQDEATEIEGKLLKEKRLRQIIIAAAAVCLSIATASLLYHLIDRQSSLESAQRKLHEGDLKAARTAYEKILKANPENWEAYLGHALCVPDDYKKQIEDYSHVLNLKPDEFAAAIALTRAYYDNKEFDHAVSSAERASKIDKTSVSALKMKADALFELGRFRESIKTIESALALKPNHVAELYYSMARAYAELRDPVKQEDCLRKALGCEPENGAYIKDLALLKARSLPAPEAKPFILRALKDLPADAELHYELGKILAKENSRQKAITELSFAIEHGLSNAATLGLRGKLYYMEKMYGHAKSDLSEAIQKDSNDSSFKSTLALVDREIELAKRRAGTRTLPSETSEELPLPAAELQGDYVGRAYELIKQGNAGYAARLLKAAVKANPADARARRYLASALFYNGDYVGASTQFAYAQSAQPLSSAELLLFGKALIKANRLEQAIKVLGQLLEEEPSFTKARVELIRAYSLAGFRDHAREICQEGLKEARSPAEYAEIKSLMP